MNSTLSISTDVELEQCGVSTSVENTYATAPMVAVQPQYQPLNEEELYNSFEEAIGGRLQIFSGRLSLLRKLQVDTYSEGKLAQYSRLSVFQKAVNKLRLFRLKRYVIFSCLALICMMLGFDIMGLLVLWSR